MYTQRTHFSYSSFCIIYCLKLSIIYNIHLFIRFRISYIHLLSKCLKIKILGIAYISFFSFFRPLRAPSLFCLTLGLSDYLSLASIQFKVIRPYLAPPPFRSSPLIFAILSRFSASLILGVLILSFSLTSCIYLFCACAAQCGLQKLFLNVKLLS